MGRKKVLGMLVVVVVLMMVVILPFVDEGSGGVMLVAKSGKKYYVRYGVSVADQGEIFFVLDRNGKPLSQFYKSYYKGYVLCKVYPTGEVIDGVVH